MSVKLLNELVDALGQRGLQEDVRAVLRDVRAAHFHLFPPPLHGTLHRLESDYLDLLARVRQSSDVARYDGDRVSASGSADPVPRAAMQEMLLTRVDGILLELYTRHADRLQNPASKRRRVGVWRDSEAAEAIADGYAQATNEQLRDVYRQPPLDTA